VYVMKSHDVSLDETYASADLGPAVPLNTRKGKTNYRSKRKGMPRLNLFIRKWARRLGMDRDFKVRRPPMARPLTKKR